MSSESLPTLLLRLSEGAGSGDLPGSLARHYRGKTFDQLLRRRILVQTQEAETWPTCRHCDCGLNARPLVDVADGWLAPCPDDAANDVRLEADDLQQFVIDPARLTGALAEESGLVGDAPYELMPGLWQLGSVSASAGSGRAVFLMLAIDIGLFAASIAAIRGAAAERAVTLLTPSDLAAVLRRELTQAGFHLVVTTTALVGSGARPFRLEVDRLTPRTVRTIRLRIILAEERVFLDGRECTIVGKPFELLQTLAQAAVDHGRFVPSGGLEQALWPKDTKSRRVTEVLYELKKQLTGAGIDEIAAAALFETKKNVGYRLNLPRDEVLIE